MPIDPIDRELLRLRALGRWQDSKALRRELWDRGERARQRSKDLQDHSATLRERSDVALARAARLIGASTILRDVGLEPSTLEVLADRAIRGWHPPDGDPRTLDRGAALVASASMGELIRFKELVGSRIPYVLGATDAGTALGLAIAMQPDLALIDVRLELASGTDLALTFPFYVPQAKTLVLTDDPERTHRLRTVGFDAQPRHADSTTLLRWIDRAA